MITMIKILRLKSDENYPFFVWRRWPNEDRCHEWACCKVAQAQVRGVDAELS